MPSLADLPELVGFFSYSRRDDQHAEGALSRLRARIYSELRLQLGRDLRLWQDTAAIPEGTLWEQEIKSAIAEAVFFIPIVTPSAVGSKHCRLEFKSFLNREQALGRGNLIFPLLYVRVPALEHEEEWRRDDVLEIIGMRQYIDWQDYPHRDLREPEIARKIELYCRNYGGPGFRQRNDVERKRPKHGGQPKKPSNARRKIGSDGPKRMRAERKKSSGTRLRPRNDAGWRRRSGSHVYRRNSDAAKTASAGQPLRRNSMCQSVAMNAFPSAPSGLLARAREGSPRAQGITTQRRSC
jgi:hypothetical protein